MQRYNSFVMSVVALLAVISFAGFATAASDVCSRGLGDPPFLASGVDSNLLLLLDNSGSMLDMAYTNQTQCFDDSFTPYDEADPNPSIYAGNYNSLIPVDPPAVATETAWYKWVDGIDPWEPNKLYAEKALVYANGIVYRAITGETSSTVSNIYSDTGVVWENLLQPNWRKNMVYQAGTFVVSPTTLYVYHTRYGGTSSDTATSPEDDIITWTRIWVWEAGTHYAEDKNVLWKNSIYRSTTAGLSAGNAPIEDTGVDWVEVDPFAWQSGKSYAKDDIVTYSGMIYKASATHTADGLSLFEDNYWTRIDEGYYEMVDAATADDVCNAGGAIKYTSSDLCIAKADSPDRVTAFVATGNMLNWLMASKFDIQKTILTGGKYLDGSDRLISENRGCSGSRFVKEVTVYSDATDYKLTMAVRGPRSEGDPMRDDRVDSSDDTTRVEILGITDTGYNATACQYAIERILAKDLNGSQSAVAACLGTVGDSVEEKARTALNHALQTCWQNDDATIDEVFSHLQTNIKDCENLYISMTAADIPEYSQAYNCFGYYNPNILHTDRFGYVGRCWGGGCSPANISNAPVCGSDYPCEFTYTEPVPGGESYLLRNTQGNGSNSDVITTEICTYVIPATGVCRRSSDWQVFYIDKNNSLCDPTAAEYATGWSSEIDPDNSETDEDSIGTIDLPNNLSGLTPQAYVCVSGAMEDFCGDSTAPEVIDASDQSISTTGTYGNLPAQLIDSGVLSQLGVDVPMKVMKGYALQQTQPIGILQKKATNLRIGAMAFNSVGSTYECTQAITNDNIESYCPAGNKDGAQVIAPVRSGTLIIDDKENTNSADDRLHVDDVVVAVNKVRATSWTPLAEAMYNAIGYYTQNTDRRLNDSDFQTDSDVVAPWTEGKIYPPGSYLLSSGTLYQTVLGGTSTGTLLSNDTGVAWSSIGDYQGSWTDNTVYYKDAIVSYEDKLYFTAGGGTSNLKLDASAAGLSGPTFDTSVLWEPLLDPVVYPCQENHILVITEGTSTADINQDIPDFISSIPIVDPSPDTQNVCKVSGLDGSTYLDDLTYYAQDANDEYLSIYPSGNASLRSSDAPFEEQPKNNLTTHIVVAGSLPVPASGIIGECKPVTLMQNAAVNGGTKKYLPGESPQQLEEQLTAIFNEIRQRASAGSAASVISSARGGEGAIYQAIFWPELVRQGQDVAKTEYTVAWAGDVHALLLDKNGYMYEDTNHDRTLKPTEDLDNDNHFDGGECTIDASNVVDCSNDTNGDGTVSTTEDLNGDGIFDPGEDLDNDGHFDNVYEDVDEDGTWQKSGNKRVILYFDKNIQKSRACYNTSILQSLGEYCTNAIDLEHVNFLWSANDWLSDFPINSAGVHSFNILDTTTNRNTYIAAERERYIFTWNDLSNDGVVDSNEVMDLVESPTAWNSLYKAFDATDATEVNNIISWLRGKDWLTDEDPNNNDLVDTGEPGDTVSGDGPLRHPLRSRQTVLPDGTTTFTWRLGDIIHSTPQTVAAPAEGYHLLYNDRSYAQFVSHYKKRRHMVYFGANDGMMHAVNAGFYSDVEKKFCFKELGADGTCPTDDDSGNAPALGMELWAYVPYNLQPHLKCLLNPLYSHKYFVDLKPRVFDAQIFEPDEDHPYGWGTILVGGLRFGGAPISAAEIDPADTTGRQFISSYFIMDITNPEKKPILLGELTQSFDAILDSQVSVDLGYSTVIPTMVIAKTGATDTIDATSNKWYLVFGSGPNGSDGMRGVSEQEAKISVLPLGGVVNSSTSLNGTLLDGFVDSDNLPSKSMRIYPDGKSDSDYSGGVGKTFQLLDSPKGFVSDPVTVDFDINPSNNGHYVSDAVYFGTVEGNFEFYPEGTPYWKGGGHLYRLVMNGSEHEIGTDSTFISLDSDWKIRPLLDLSRKADGTPTVTGNLMQSITAAPSVGTDGNRYWIYFGTGRFFDPDDKTDREQQSYYGIKEPVDSLGKLTWNEVELAGGETSLPGGKGLLKVDEILVPESNDGSALLACRDSTTDCLPTGVNTFDKLESYIAGIGDGSCSDGKNNCADGWYKDFYPYSNRERNVGQATLLGGLVTFTTYQPFTDICQVEGISYLYGVHYKTGTSWYENVFGAYGLDGSYVKNKLDLGRGLTTTPNLFVGAPSGDGSGVKAFVQTSTGEIKEIGQENLPLKAARSGRSSWKFYQRP